MPAPRLIRASFIGTAVVCAVTTVAAAGYSPVSDWLKLPAGRAQLGNMHGDIAVSAKGEVFVSVQDPAAGLQVTLHGRPFDKTGKYLTSFGGTQAPERVAGLRETLKYVTSFGGNKAPYNFNTLHKPAIDTRFQPARIIAVDRANNRGVHMSLSGEFLGVVA